MLKGKKNGERTSAAARLKIISAFYTLRNTTTIQ